MTNVRASVMMFLKLFFVASLLESISADQSGIWTDEHVLQALGDHGDRIADLEKLVKTLTESHVTLQQEVTTLKATNGQLLLQIKNVTENCFSYLKCSGMDTSVTTTMTSFLSTDTLTKPMLTNLSATDLSTHMPLINVNPNTTTPRVQENTTQSTVRQSSVTSSVKTNGIQTTTTPSTTTTGKNAFRNCDDALMDGGGRNGTYEIKLGTTGPMLSVFCELINSEAWLVIQRRQDGTVNFNRDWQAYKNGFGDIDGEFWLGNENIHTLTSNDVYTLHIDMQDWGGNHVYVEYDHFDVGSELANYQLSVGSYHGSAGDSFHFHDSSLLQHNLMPFSTPERDNDYSFLNCADELKSGWWFNSCYSSNLNGKYLGHPYGQRKLGESSGQPTLEGTGIEWYPYRRRQYSMRKVEMKIKRATRAHLFGKK